MDIFVLLIVGGICFYQGGKAFSAEDVTKVFRKYPLPVKDVKKYNHFCGVLIIGFGIAAVLTLAGMMLSSGWLRLLLVVLVVVEAIVMSLIYRYGESKLCVSPEKKKK